MFIHEAKKYTKAGINKKEKSMDGGWGWGERAAPIPDPPIQAFFTFLLVPAFLYVFILENKRSKS
jgi:hypothetical protein